MHVQMVPKSDEAERLGLQAIIAVCSLGPGCVRTELLVELTKVLRTINRPQMVVAMATPPDKETDYNFKTERGWNRPDLG